MPLLSLKELGSVSPEVNTPFGCRCRAGYVSSLCLAATACFSQYLYFLRTAALGNMWKKQGAGHQRTEPWALGRHRTGGRQGRCCGVYCLILFVYCSFVRSGNHEMTPGSSDRKLCVLSHRVHFQFDLLCNLDTIFVVSLCCEF